MHNKVYTLKCSSCLKFTQLKIHLDSCTHLCIYTYINKCALNLHTNCRRYQQVASKQQNKVTDITFVNSLPIKENHLQQSIYLYAQIVIKTAPTQTSAAASQSYCSLAIIQFLLIKTRVFCLDLFTTRLSYKSSLNGSR